MFGVTRAAPRTHYNLPFGGCLDDVWGCLRLVSGLLATRMRQGCDSGATGMRQGCDRPECGACRIRVASVSHLGHLFGGSGEFIVGGAVCEAPAHITSEYSGGGRG